MNDLEQFLKSQAEIEARNDQSTALEKLCKLPTHLKISRRRKDLLQSERRRSKRMEVKANPRKSKKRRSAEVHSEERCFFFQRELRRYERKCPII
ncbi:hypothetical protein AAC387_Pa02g2985 [Persea americana]